MSIKSEYLNIDPETKKELSDTDNVMKTKDTKAEIVNSISIEPKQIIEERPIFLCTSCNMTEQYDCFGDRVPFNRNIRTKVDYYLARDPFSPRNKKQLLILGSVCSMCDKDVCIKPECSIFYSKFFCSICARKYIDNFPLCIQEKIKTAKRI